MTGRLCALLWLVACALGLTSGRAAGEAGRTVLLVLDPASEVLAPRIAAEVGALGFAVRRSRADEPELGLVERARAAQAFAAVAVSSETHERIEITILDRVTGKTVQGELALRSLADGATRELVALRVTELLRASLMEVAAPHPPRGEVPPSPAVRDVAVEASTIKRRPARLRLGAGAGVFVVPRLSAAPLLELSANYRVGTRFELGMAFGSQLAASARREPEGRVETTARWASLGPELLLLSGERAVELALGARLAVIALSANGQSRTDEFDGRSELAWLPASLLSLDSRARLAKGVRWTLRSSLGQTWHDPALLVGDRRIGSWGRPWLQCSTGVLVEVP